MKEKNFFWPRNLKMLRERKQLTQDQLSEKLEISRTNLKAYESGATKNPPFEIQIKVSDFFKISIDSMIRIDLSKLGELKLRDLEAGNDVYTAGKKLRVLATTVTPDNKEQVEMVTHKAKAGYAAGYGDPDYISSLPVFHMPQLPQDKKFRMFPVSGDSMLPVPEGAYVIVEYVQDWQSVADGTPGVIITKNDGIVFKVMYNRIVTEGALPLVSLNPLYKPFDIDVSEVVEVWKYHSYWTDGTLQSFTNQEILLSTLSSLQSEISEISKKINKVRI